MTDKELLAECIARGGTVGPSMAELIAMDKSEPLEPMIEVRTVNKKSKMNKTEARHAARLDDRKKAGEIESYSFEAVKLRLNDRCFFTPDFFVRYDPWHCGFEEVKGPYFWEDARVKLLTAARLFPMFSFRLYQTGKEMVVISSE